MVMTEVTEINMAEMKERAESLGIDPEEMTEIELIRSIQIAEGSTPCFATSSGQCDQFGCSFMQSCLSTSLEKSSQAEEHLAWLAETARGITELIQSYNELPILNNIETREQVNVTPAEGPSLGMAPAGT